MQKLAALSLLCLGAVTSAATARAETFSLDPATAGVPESLFQQGHRPDAQVGWYVAPSHGFTSIDGSRPNMVGVRSALVLNRTWGFGLAGNLIGNDRNDFGDKETFQFGGYGGAYFQYIFRSNGLVHGFADLTAGGGGWCARTTNQTGKDDCNGREFAFLEPTLNLEVNIVQNVRVSAGAGYRAAIAEEGEGLTSRQLSGVVARTSVVIGMF
jgi:hypothetical protein